MNWMTPILFSIGWLNVRTVDICLLIGIFFGLFVYWRKIKYDSEYNEGEAFDGFLISLLMGWLAGRAGYILLNFDSFGLNVGNWLNVLAYPGINIAVAMIVSGWYLYGWAKRHKFDAFKLLDFWATAASLSLAFYHFGFFLSGLGFGYETNWVTGVTPPGMMMKLQPVELYWTIFYIMLFIYLVRAEYKYRYYEWYKNGRSTAESGFLVAAFMILNGVAGLLMLLVGTGTIVVAGIDLEWLVQALILVWGGGMMWVRSGRKLGGKKKRRVNAKNTEEEKGLEIVEGSATATISVGGSPKPKSKERPTLKETVAPKPPRRIEMKKVATGVTTKVTKQIDKKISKEIIPIDTKKNALRKIDLKNVSKEAPEPKKKRTSAAKSSKNKAKKEIRRFKLN